MSRGGARKVAAPRTILVLGASGMLGHRLLVLLSRLGHRVMGTARGSTDALGEKLALAQSALVDGISVEREGAVESVLDRYRPDVVVNCIGVVKQLADAGNPLVAIPVNALFPHRLSAACGERGIRMLHFSTDCVFSGAAGPYAETSVPDARDLYGRSKLLGEVNARHALTLRTSIIGHEVGEGTGLLSWILRSRGRQVSGYARALYTGVTTDFMAEVVHRLVVEFPDLCGVWHLASETISKYDLLRLVNTIYGLDMDVARDEEFHCDRRLDGSLFRRRTGIVAPPWPEMIERMHIIQSGVEEPG